MLEEAVMQGSSMAIWMMWPGEWKLNSRMGKVTQK